MSKPTHWSILFVDYNESRNSSLLRKLMTDGFL